MPDPTTTNAHAHATTDAHAPGAPLPPGEYAALLGLDWGESTHALALQERGAVRPETLTLAHSAEALHGWLDELKTRFAGQRVAVAIEASKGPVVAALREHAAWLVLYPVHSTTSRRFRQALTPSGAKDDGPDAKTLLEILTHHRAHLRALLPQDDATRRLDVLAQLRRKLVDERTHATNQLQSLLKGYFPQALDLVGNQLYSPLTLAFLRRWPTLAEVQRSRSATLRAFYHTHQVRRPEAVQRRLDLVTQARPLTSDPVLLEVGPLHLAALLDLISALNRRVAELDAKLHTALSAHADADLFTSLPGAGPAMAPRLCVLFGADRARWTGPAELQKYYGIAPVLERSGKQSWVHWRWNAPVFARQSLVEWAGLSVKYCAWAKAYYQQQIAKGKTHSMTLRSLAFKWLRILWRCWQDRTPYDDARYLQSLQEKKVPYLSYLPVAPTATAT